MTKLTTLEEEVLKYLIKNGGPRKGISVNIPNVDMGYIIQAVKQLHSLGLVIDCSDNLCAGAFLTEKGLSYFDELEKEEYGELFDTIRTLDSYIKRANDLKTSKNTEEISTFIRHIYFTYCDKDNALYGFKTSFGDDAKEDLDSYYYDLDYIIMMLTKIKDEKRAEAKALQVEKIKIENHIHNENKNDNRNVIDIKLDLIQVFTQINESNEFSDAEKIELQRLIQSALQEKNKKSLWEKIKTIFGKIAGKTFDVAVAILPILTEAMLKAKGIL